MTALAFAHASSVPLFREQRTHRLMFGEKPHFRRVTPTYWECVGRGRLGYGGTAKEAEGHWKAMQECRQQ